MRVTSEFWVSAFTRRAFGEGGFAAVLRRGAAEAGAIFLVFRDRTGEGTLFGPAPQSSYEMAGPGDRQFAELMRTTDEQALQARLDKEVRFDPDLWVVEAEVDPAKLESLLGLRTR